MLRQEGTDAIRNGVVDSPEGIRGHATSSKVAYDVTTERVAVRTSGLGHVQVQQLPDGRGPRWDNPRSWRPTPGCAESPAVTERTGLDSAADGEGRCSKNGGRHRAWGDDLGVQSHQLAPWQGSRTLQ